MQLMSMFLIYPFIVQTVIGIVVNGYCAYYFAIVTKKIGAFSILASFFLMANCFVLLPNLFIVPVEHFDWFHVTLWVNERLGQIALIGYYSGYMARFVLAINRYMAIHHYIRYAYYFSNKKVIIIVGCIAVISIVIVSPATFADICYFSFDGLTWQYHDTPVCNFMAKAFDLYLGVVCALAIFSLDIMLILKMEIRIFVQALVSNLYLVLMLLSFHVLEKVYAKTANSKFLMNTFVWNSYHAFDGIFIGLFHSDVMKHLKTIFRRKNKILSVQQVNTTVRGSRTKPKAS
uniref:7TM_GPCR_Srx domain-containing protein n=1 Tax=Rhabditophanes sp. KR3021 TaxID=114890 RepID=A0AC35UEH3_9BILA